MNSREEIDNFELPLRCLEPDKRYLYVQLGSTNLDSGTCEVQEYDVLGRKEENIRIMRVADVNALGLVSIEKEEEFNISSDIGREYINNRFSQDD